MKRLITVTDDITGAADSGGYFVQRGQKLTIYTNGAYCEKQDGQEITAFNLSTRNTSPKQAYERHYEICSKLRNLSDYMIMKKIGTGFRGNDAFELSGMLDAMPDALCFIVDHAPVLGTFTLYGNQYCEGQILAKSLYASDPVMPPKDSYIPAILAEGTGYSIGTVDIDAVKDGGKDDGLRLLRAVKNEIDEGKRIIVFDAVTAADSMKLVSCLSPVYPNAFWTGSLGLGETMADYLYGEEKIPDAVYSEKRCICFTASVYEAAGRQIEYSKNRGLYVCEVDIDRIIEGDTGEIKRKSLECVSAGMNGNVLLRPRVGRSADLDGISKRILEIMAECADIVANMAEYDRLVVIGGETAQAIFHRLGIRKLFLRSLPEVGTAIGEIAFDEDVSYHSTAAGGRVLEFALKGGSIGSDAALERMMGKRVQE